MGIRILHYAIAICLLAVVCAVFGQVVLRYLTYQPVAWTEEFARIAFIWLCFLGAAEGVRRSMHFSVNLLVGRLGIHARKLKVLLNLTQALAYGLVTYAGVVILPVVHGQSSVTLDIPMSLAYAAIPVGFGLMSCFALQLVIKDLAGQEGGS